MRTRIKEIVIKIGYSIFKIVRAPIKWYWKKFNIKTQGVRVMIVHKDSIVLVRHWYNNLWVMPGGGIKKHETPEQAAIREIQEELGISDIQLEYCLGIYSNNQEGKNDTVYCFVVILDSKILLRKKFNLEISDSTWTQFDLLPEGVSRATKNRITEYIHNNISKEIRPWS
jgi:8-oxo-dGTP pyrophosphatase MutT (NUDIX family)